MLARWCLIQRNNRGKNALSLKSIETYMYKTQISSRPGRDDGSKQHLVEGRVGAADEQVRRHAQLEHLRCIRKYGCRIFSSWRMERLK